MKTRFISAAAAWVCLAVFLCACGKQAPDVTTEPSVFTPWSEAEVFTVPASTTAAGKDEKPSDDTQQILSRIGQARAVYGLFSASRPQLDKEDSLEVEEDLFGYRVSDPQFSTMEKLQAYVSSVFSDEITQRLLNIGIYTEYDGKLYALDVGMEPCAFSDPVVEITEKTDSSESYRMTLMVDTDGDGVPDTEKDRKFVYQKTGDGKWVFTRFDEY